MIKPIGNCVILEENSDGTNEFGIQTESQTYRVVSKGTGIKSKSGVRLPVDVEIGKVVILKSNEVQKLALDGNVYYQTDEDNIAIEIGD